jgi:hypothetical protein
MRHVNVVAPDVQDEQNWNYEQSINSGYALNRNHLWPIGYICQTHKSPSFSSPSDCLTRGYISLREV